MRMCFFGSSLVSSYWNGAATYYRGLLRALSLRGHAIAFYEPDAFDRQKNRDIPNPGWAEVVVYPATDDGWPRALEHAAKGADLLVKASGVGVFDAELDAAVPAAAAPNTVTAYWDVDAPATLESMTLDEHHLLRRMIPRYGLVFTYGGGEPVIQAYKAFGATHCVPIYNALDPETHFRANPEPRFACDLSFLGNRLPDREKRVEDFFLAAAGRLPGKAFILGGSGWETKSLPHNVRRTGHVGTSDHNVLFSSSYATLNINRDSMARYGFSPPTRVFEAAGAASCIITDNWEGIEMFLAPGEEILPARDGAEVADLLAGLTPHRARAIGNAARARVLARHTYSQRALDVERALGSATEGAAA
jgi:spore maturation protein CgeB